MKTNAVLKNLGLALLATSANAANKQSQPNIIYILADDLGYGDVGCYGQKIIKTPNIDKLAANGMLFTQHYAGCTVSAPSRSSLMTGLHTGHTFIRGNKENDPEGQYPLPANTFGIAKMLQQAGYTTGAFGKWGLGSPGSTGDPNNQGFDEFYGYNCQRLAHNYYPYHLWHNQTKIMLEGNSGEKKEQYAQDLIHQQALQFLQKNAGNKFFMFLPYVLPHAELTSPEDSILNLYKDKIAEKIPYKGVESGEGYKDGAYGSSVNPHADFAAMISRLDAYVGDVVSELKRLGLDKNTIIMFTSDNGPHREGGADPDFFNSYGPLRGVKRDMFEGGIRVPMIASWPGTIQVGSKTDHISAFWDILPTFKSLAAIKSSVKTDGISMLPTLLSKSNQKTHKYLYWEFHEGGGKLAVRMGNWKGIKLNYAKNPNGKMQLYDLSTDLHEDKDVAAQFPKVVAQLDKIMKTARTESGIFNFGSETIIK
jgi:arylsulfatase A-like enzyme